MTPQNPTTSRPATQGNTQHTHAQSIADALLIAAAPDLLAALEIAATTLETVYRERDPKNIAAKCAAERSRAAIAKATQQPS